MISSAMAPMRRFGVRRIGLNNLISNMADDLTRSSAKNQPILAQESDLIHWCGVRRQAQPEVPNPQPHTPPPKVTYSEAHDKEIKEILDLGRQGRWEEARAKTAALQQQDPKNPLVARVQSWVTQQEQQRREQALEDKIRE